MSGSQLQQSACLFCVDFVAEVGCWLPPIRSSREQTAKIGGMDRQTLRNWVIPFNQHGPDGLVNKLAPSSATWVDDCTRECLALIADTSISGFRKAHLARGRARLEEINV